MSKPITEKTLKEFHNWLVNRANAHTVATNYERARGLLEAASKMSQWFAFDPQTTDPLLPTKAEANNTHGLHWTQAESYTSSYVYTLRNASGQPLGGISGLPSSPTKEARLRFHARYYGANGWLECGDFGNVIDAKESVEDNLNLTQAHRPGPLPNPLNPPLWFRDDHRHPTLSQMFDFNMMCVGIVTQRHVGDEYEPLFLAEVMITDNEWTRIGYLANLGDAEHLVAAK